MWPLIQVAVLVPLHFAVAVRDLHEPHAALDEAAGHQALPAEVRGHRIVDAVELLRRLAFRRTGPATSGIADLHAEGQLERIDAAFQRRVAARRRRGARGSSRRADRAAAAAVARSMRALRMCFTLAWSDGHAGVADAACPGSTAGRNAAPQLLTPPWASVGQIVMNAGQVLVLGAQAVA